MGVIWELRQPHFPPPQRGGGAGGEGERATTSTRATISPRPMGEGGQGGRGNAPKDDEPRQKLRKTTNPLLDIMGIIFRLPEILCPIMLSRVLFRDIQTATAKYGVALCVGTRRAVAFPPLGGWGGRGQSRLPVIQIAGGSAPAPQ